MTYSVRIASCLGATAFGAFLLIAISRAYAVDNRCCQAVFPFNGCSGCIRVLSNPDGYINAGNRSALRCVTTSLTKECDQGLDICLDVTNVDVFGDSTCSTVIAVASVALNAQQCDMMDDPCAGM